ncbi:MAG: SHOCT domain-containing protein [Bacteroidota bacterium]
MSSLEELERLTRLHEQGEITDEEFEAFKKKILEEEAMEPPTVQDIPIKAQPNLRGTIKDKYDRIKRRIYGENTTPLPMHDPIDTIPVPEASGINWPKYIKAFFVLALVGVAGYYGYKAIPKTEVAPTVAAVVADSTVEEEFDDPFALTPQQMATIDTVKFQTLPDSLGYTVNYPANWLTLQRAVTKRGKGKNAVIIPAKNQSLISKDGKFTVQLTVADTAKTNLEKKMKLDTAASKGRLVNYNSMRYNYYLVSGELNGKVFYKKTLLKDSTFKTLTILYPKAEKAKYDPVAVKMGQSFK